jgi:V8-like Glu-specific endopeptidase
MCNCNKNEYELLPEFEVMSNEGYNFEINQRNTRFGSPRGANKFSGNRSAMSGLPDTLDTSQLEYEGTPGGCDGGDISGSRTRVTNTRVEPFKHICKIEMLDTSGKLKGWCTGTLISPNKVLTCAHCVYDRSSSSYHQGPIRVIPGKNGSGRSAATEPFDSAMSTRINIPDQYRTAPTYDAAIPFDYAIITLNEKIGNRIGYWRRIAYKPDDLLLRNKVNTAGYPQDLDPTGDTLFKAYDRNVATHPQTIEFLLDTCHGQSGGPIWVRWQQYRVIVGIVKRLDDPNTGVVANVGVRMTPAVLANIRKWVTS